MLLWQREKVQALLYAIASTGRAGESRKYFCLSTSNVKRRKFLAIVGSVALAMSIGLPSLEREIPRPSQAFIEFLERSLRDIYKSSGIPRAMFDELVTMEATSRAYPIV